MNIGEAVIQELREQEGWTETELDMPEHAWQRKVWELFEHPESSTMARILATFSVLVITISITVFCMETMPMFERYTILFLYKKLEYPHGLKCFLEFAHFLA